MWPGGSVVRGKCGRIFGSDGWGSLTWGEKVEAGILKLEGAPGFQHKGTGAQKMKKRPYSAYSGDSGDSGDSGHCMTATLGYGLAVVVDGLGAVDSREWWSSQRLDATTK